jgi:phosphomannomutase
VSDAVATPTPAGAAAEAAIPTLPIAFGTDGWRGRVAEEYTFENVRRCAEGVAEWVRAEGTASRGIVIAWDRRFVSEHFARAAAEVLLAYDIPVAISRTAVPTQMSSMEVVERKSAAGIVITASHNPWTDNGFKIKAPTGSAAGPAVIAEVERVIHSRVADHPPRRPFADGEAAGLVEWYEPFDRYRAYVERSLDLEELRAADIHVLIEPMFGAGAGWIPRLMDGGKLQVTEIHSERNPWFGGVNPEPIRPNIDEALGILAGGGYDLGLLLDGDADRAGAADERGVFIHQLEVMGLLMYYLLEHRALRAPVVYTVNETSMVERLGERYGVPVHEVPVGFKYVGPKMIETGAMMGGEESGGYGFGMHLPERDGIYADLLLLDLFLKERAAGRWPVSRAVAHLHELAGESFYSRIDVHVAPARYAAVKEQLLRGLAAAPPTQLAGSPVGRMVSLTTNDGLKLWLADGSWLLIRTSGTEPLVRIYAEAASADRRDALLADGERLVRAAE